MFVRLVGFTWIQSLCIFFNGAICNNWNWDCLCHFYVWKFNLIRLEMEWINKQYKVKHSFIHPKWMSRTVKYIIWKWCPYFNAYCLAGFEKIIINNWHWKNVRNMRNVSNLTNSSPGKYSDLKINCHKNSNNRQCLLS